MQLRRIVLEREVHRSHIRGIVDRNRQPRIRHRRCIVDVLTRPAGEVVHADHTGSHRVTHGKGIRVVVIHLRVDQVPIAVEQVGVVSYRGKPWHCS